MDAERSDRRIIAVAILGVVVLAAVLVVGIALRSDGASTTTSGTFSGAVSIDDGRVLWLRSAGTGSPTVILEAGAHDSSDTWTVSDSPAAPVFDEVAAFTHCPRTTDPGRCSTRIRRC